MIEEDDDEQSPEHTYTVDDLIKRAERQPAPTLQEHENEEKRLANQQKRQNIGLSGAYAKGALAATAVQIGIADVGFFVYGFTNHWNIPSTVIDVWLGATVVQVIGVVLVITKSLFPSSGG